MEIFCEDCNHLDTWNDSITEHTCHHPKNMAKNTGLRWLLKKPQVCTVIRHPSDINKKNNCKWFTAKRTEE